MRKVVSILIWEGARERIGMEPPPDDKLHPPGSDDPFWTETWWFDFIVPERKLSGQLYVFARPNLKVVASAAYLWDDTGSELSNCLYSRVLWQLPFPEGDLSEIRLANGMHFRCVEPLAQYAVRYLDPDDGEIDVNLMFQAVREPNYMGQGHFDQPGRFTGTIRIQDETIPVSSYGMRDRSWSLRPQFGIAIYPGGPGHNAWDYATASDRDGFHAITFDTTVVGGYLLRDGTLSPLASGQREVLERHDDGPVRVRIDARDQLGRELQAEGRCVNRLHLLMNPNLFGWNSLTEWRLSGLTAWGEDRDNWTAAAIRRFRRAKLGR